MRLIDAISLLDNHTQTIRVRGKLIGYVTYEDISNAPTVDAEPVRHGHWELDEKTSANHIEKIYVCSACRNNEAWGETEKSRYCSYCGAKMDEVEVEEYEPEENPYIPW